MKAREFLGRIRYLFSRDRFAEDLREEMRLHIELRAAKLREWGLASDEAGFAARRQFGNRGQWEDRSRDIWGWMMWERVVQDFRMGVRALRKTPGFTCVAVLTLAVGLGMNTAVYSVVNAVMLRQLPYAQPGQLVSLWEEHPQGHDKFSSHGDGLNAAGGAGALTRTSVAVANLADYSASQTMAGMASFDGAGMNLTGIGLPERIAGLAVSANFFAVLGVEPLRGRAFRAEDDTPDAPAVALVSYDFWQRRLGGDTEVLERSVMLDGRPRRIVGVLPRGFQSPSELVEGVAREFYVPAAYSIGELHDRGDHGVAVVARLRPGVTLRAAQADLRVIQARLARQYPATNKEMYPVIGALRDDVVKGTGTALWSLLGASGLLGI
jgi:hypothetical protein